MAEVGPHVGIIARQNGGLLLAALRNANRVLFHLTVSIGADSGNGLRPHFAKLDIRDPPNAGFQMGADFIIRHAASCNGENVLVSVDPMVLNEGQRLDEVLAGWGHWRWPLIWMDEGHLRPLVSSGDASVLTHETGERLPV